MKLAKLNLGRTLGLVGLAVLLLGWALAPTRAQQGSLVGGQVYAPPETWISYDPAQLGVNAIALPASGNSAASNFIDLRGAKEITGYFACTNSTSWTLFGNFTDENGATTAESIPLFTLSNGSSGSIFWHMGSESGTSANPTSGTISSLQEVRLPQRALSFSFGNGSTTAGTCTARLFLQY